MKYEKIKIFGDSIFRGVMYDENTDRFILRRGFGYDMLRSEGANVVNHSRIGATVRNGKSTLDKHIENIDERTLVLFEFGGNDCDFDWKKVSDDPDGEHLPHISPEDFVKTYSEAVASAKDKGANVAVASLVPVDSSKYMRRISRELSYGNILKWLGDESMLFRWHEYYSRLAEKVARELGCLFVDIRKEFLLRHDYNELICADGIHPTQKGHEMIENILCRYILDEA